MFDEILLNLIFSSLIFMESIYMVFSKYLNIQRAGAGAAAELFIGVSRRTWPRKTLVNTRVNSTN